MKHFLPLQHFTTTRKHFRPLYELYTARKCSNFAANCFNNLAWLAHKNEYYLTKGKKFVPPLHQYYLACYGEKGSMNNYYYFKQCISASL